MSKTYRTIFSKSAEEDLDGIIDYYLAINVEYARKMLQSIEKRLSELKEYRESGRIVPELERQGIREYRELIEGNYRILFSIREDVVMVHEILDARRNVEELLLSKLMRNYE
jgi:toxin ParE1/3/4